MENSSTSTTVSSKTSKRRFRALLYTTIVIIGIAVIISGMWFFWWRFERTTDDAYVHGNQIRITSQIPGIVVSILADNTDLVEENQILIELDKTDQKIFLEEAKAHLGTTLRSIVQKFENVFILATQYKMRMTEIALKEVEYLDRKRVVDTGAIPKEEFLRAETAFLMAKLDVERAKLELIRSISEVQNSSVTTHPYVERAKEEVKRAWVNLERCTIRSPARGIVGRRRAEVGESINSNTSLMVVVPLNQMWVEANFKEEDIAHIRIGQSVLVYSDTYGRSIPFTGQVIGIDSGTGSAFSPLPPQNATGNWIKIVQRVPVRISINPDQLEKYPLRLGLSMYAKVNVEGDFGKRIPSVSRQKPIYQTDVFSNQEEGVEDVINQIIRDNVSMNYSLPDEILSLIG